MEQIVKLYKLKTNHWELRHRRNNFEKIQFIIDRHREIEGESHLIGLPATHLYYKRIHYHLYNFNQTVSVSPWKSFFPEVLTSGLDFNRQTPSFVLFAHNENFLFVIVGGTGHYVVKRFMDANFGLDITTRIIDPNIDIIRFVETRGITGNIAGKSELYRQDQKIIDIDAFGKVFKKILFEINENALLEFFQINLGSIRRNRICGQATEGFCIKMGMDFSSLHKYIINCINVLQRDVKINISTFIPILDDYYIDKSISISLFKTIQERLLHEEIEIGQLSFFDYDFCHPKKTLLFYECDWYQVYRKNSQESFWETDDKNTIFNAVLDYAKEHIDVSSLKHVMSFLGGVKVYGIKNEIIETTAPFMPHLSCEFDHQDKTIFKIDNQWYEIRGDFINQLNIQCNYVFKSYKAPNLLPEIWINPSEKEYSEDWYNKLYLSYDNFCVLDKVLSQNIELCDLLFYTDEKLYLIHVKKGFNGMMRDLTSQVSVSARRLWIDLQTEDKPFLTELYHKFEVHNNYEFSNQLGFEEFIDLFESKEIEFIIAFCSMNKTNRKVFREVETFGSNIAKHSLTEVVKQMKDQEYRVKILEIDHRFE